MMNSNFVFQAMHYFGSKFHREKMIKPVVFAILGIALLADGARGAIGMRSFATFIGTWGIAGIENVIAILLCILAAKDFYLRNKNNLFRFITLGIFMLSLGGLFEWTELAVDAWHARWDDQVNILLNQGASTSIEVSASSLPIATWRAVHCSAQKLDEPTFWRIEYTINCPNQPKTNVTLFVRGDQADAWIHRD